MFYLIPTAYATSTASTSAELVEAQINYFITQFGSLFWSPFGIWAVFALGISIAIMIWRRIRGTGRRPG